LLFSLPRYRLSVKFQSGAALALLAALQNARKNCRTLLEERTISFLPVVGVYGRMPDVMLASSKKRMGLAAILLFYITGSK
jgi:hypothetical protein